MRLEDEPFKYFFGFLILISLWKLTKFGFPCFRDRFRPVPIATRVRVRAKKQALSVAAANDDGLFQNQRIAQTYGEDTNRETYRECCT